MQHPLEHFFGCEQLEPGVISSEKLRGAFLNSAAIRPDQDPCYFRDRATRPCA